MSIKNASSFMSTVVSTCTLIEKLTGHAFDILVSPPTSAAGVRSP